MTMVESTDKLRGRFQRLRKRMSLELVSHTLTLHPKTLQNFLDGEDMRLSTLAQIEQWCDQQEQEAV